MTSLNSLKEILGSPGFIVLIETSSENALEIGLDAVKMLIEDKQKGIIISANRPFSNVINLYKKNNIDTSRLFFIDLVSQSQSENLTKSNNVVYIEHVSDLTSISISLVKAIETIKGRKFVFIDSITTMLIHNNEHSLARFVHGILTRLRIDGVNGVMMLLENKESNEIRAEIAQLCDKVIKL